MEREDQTADVPSTLEIETLALLRELSGKPEESQLLVQVAAWVLSAAASGVLGNVAHSWVLDKYRNRPRALGASKAEPPDLKERWLLARLALQARCAEIGYPVPRFESLDKVGWRDAGDRFLLEVHSYDLRAHVLIPKGPLDDHRIEVTIFTIANRLPWL